MQIPWKKDKWADFEILSLRTFIWRGCEVVNIKFIKRLDIPNLMTLFWLKKHITQNRKRFINLIKKYKLFWENKKFLKAYDRLLVICFCYFCKNNCFSFFRVGSCSCNADSFLCKLGPKLAVVRGFTNFFFSELLDCNTSHKLLILIESPNIFRRKSAEKQTWHVVVI